MLSPLLLKEELHIIFGRVSTLFSKSLADAYARLEPLVSRMYSAFLGVTLVSAYMGDHSCWRQPASQEKHLIAHGGLSVSVICAVCYQGPAWEAQCHADTHLMLSTLQALPLDPQTGSSTMEHLTQLCTLRFADPSPSGYTIPGQLPSPLSYSSASQGSTPGTAASLAAASGAPSPSAGRQLEQVSIPCMPGPFHRHERSKSWLYVHSEVCLPLMSLMYAFRRSPLLSV